MEQLKLVRIAKFVRSEVFLIGISAVVLIIVGLSVFSFFSRTKQYPGVKWQNGIIPGQTTITELTKALGSPEKTESTAGATLYFYPTSNKNRPDQLEIRNDKVQIIKEPVIAKEKGTLNDFIQQLGQPEAILYGQHGLAAPGNFWGSKGIMVFGNSYSGLVVEIWYFPPTTLSQFLAVHHDLGKASALPF